jgi:TolB-like protein
LPSRFGRVSRVAAPVWITAGLALAIGLAGAGWWRNHQSEPIPIAVLPLINLSQDSANDYFADGLTGEIIRDLSIIDGLAVRSQTSSFVFKGKPQNVRDAGKQLGAEYILEGSVLRSAQRLRINVQLVRARDDFPLWSDRYDRELTDVFAVQDEISRGIVNSLRLKLGRGRRRYETSAEAYDFYLRARALEITHGGGGANVSVGPYEQAIAKDPSFAPAYAGLAAAYVYRTGEDRIDWVGPDRAEEMSRMRVMAQKALQLDPLLADAHAALGAVYARDGQWDQSEQSFRRAIELDPRTSFTRTQFARNLLMPLGRTGEAVEQLRLAEKADPLSPSVQLFFAYGLISAGRFEEAATHSQPRSAILARARLLQGRINEAIPILEALFDGRPTKPSAGLLGYAYALAGRREEAEKVAALQPRPFEQAEIFVALGDKDRAFEALERAIPLGPVRIGRNLTHPELAPLRGDPRLKALRKRVGLPE